MAKCKTCKNQIKKTWEYCPKCGQKTKEQKYEIKIDKIKYLVERQKSGRIIYDIFYNNMEYMIQRTLSQSKKRCEIRDKLGDFVNLNLGSLRIFSLLYQKPEYINEFFELGKLLGYFATIFTLKLAKKTEYIGLRYDSDIFWRVISSKEIQKYHKIAWEVGKEGILEFVGVDKKEGIIKYHLKESPMLVFESNKPLCFFEIATQCGVAEALSNVYWTGKEKKCECNGDEYCDFKITLEKGYHKPNIEEFSKKESEDLLSQCIESVVSRDKTKRHKLGNTINLVDDQIINYFLVSLSPGHNVLSKYSGCFAGEKIIEKSNISGWENILDYLVDLFKYMKVGLLKVKSKTSDKIELLMEESVYSSGIKNINMKLDTFIAGIIEGALNKATNQKWSVEETKCLANGDNYCEFTCKTR